MTNTNIEAGLGWPGPGHPLAHGLSRRWWIFLLRGLAAIAFGAVAFLWPGLTVLTFAALWGLYALADGVLALALATFAKDGGMARRVWIGLLGVLGVLAGLAAVSQPAAAAVVLVLFIGVWAVFVGALQIWGAFWLRKEIEGEWLLVLGGIVSGALGVALIARPAAGALTVVWLIAACSVMAGFVYLALAARLRGLRHTY